MCMGDPKKLHWKFCDSYDCCIGFNPVPATGFTMEEARQLDKYEDEQRRMAETVANAKKNLQNKTENDLVPFGDSTLGKPYEVSPNKDDDVAEPPSLRGEPLYKTLTVGATTYKISPGQIEVSYDKDPELSVSTDKYSSTFGPKMMKELSTIVKIDDNYDFGKILDAVNGAIGVPTGVLTGTTNWPTAHPETSSADGEKPEVKPNFQVDPPYDVEDDASVRDVIEGLYKHWKRSADNHPGGKSIFGNYKKLAETMLEVLTLLDTENIE